MSFIGTIIIGFVAGIIARFLAPGPNKPSGFIMTTLLGIAGAFVATWLGQAIGWYGPNDGARWIGSIVGAVLILTIYNFMTARRAVDNTGTGPRRWL